MCQQAHNGGDYIQTQAVIAWMCIRITKNSQEHSSQSVYRARIAVQHHLRSS